MLRLEKIRRLYIEFCNHYITTRVFAEHHGLSVQKAERVINIGRKLHRRYKQRMGYDEAN